MLSRVSAIAGVLILLCALAIGAALAVGAAQPVMAVTVIPDSQRLRDFALIDLRVGVIVRPNIPGFDLPDSSYSIYGRRIYSPRVTEDHGTRFAITDMVSRRVYPVRKFNHVALSGYFWSHDGRFVSHIGFSQNTHTLLITDAEEGVAVPFRFGGLPRPLVGHAGEFIPTDHLSWPFWSPVGHALIIHRQGQVIRVDAEPARITILSAPNIHVNDSTWSPDGTRLALSVITATDLASFHYVEIIDAASGELIARVEPAAVSISTLWSPDSQRLLLRRYIGQDYVYTIWDFTTGQETLIEGMSGSYRTLTTPVWSADGRWLAFSRAQATRVGGVQTLTATEMMITDLEGEITWPLPNFTQADDLRWSPDGQWVAGILSQMGGQPTIRLFPAHGGPMRSLPGVPVGWTHDNRLVTYVDDTALAEVTVRVIDPRTGDMISRHVHLNAPLRDVILWREE
jgi:hypothetical protein